MKNYEVLIKQSELLSEIKQLASKLSNEELKIASKSVKDELVVKRL